MIALQIANNRLEFKLCHCVWAYVCVCVGGGILIALQQLSLSHKVYVMQILCEYWEIVKVRLREIQKGIEERESASGRGGGPEGKEFVIGEKAGR